MYSTCTWLYKREYSEFPVKAAVEEHTSVRRYLALPGVISSCLSDAYHFPDIRHRSYLTDPCYRTFTFQWQSYMYTQEVYRSAFNMMCKIWNTLCTVYQCTTGLTNIESCMSIQFAFISNYLLSPDSIFQIEHYTVLYMYMYILHWGRVVSVIFPVLILPIWCCTYCKLHVLTKI